MTTIGCWFVQSIFPTTRRTLIEHYFLIQCAMHMVTGLPILSNRQYLYSTCTYSIVQVLQYSTYSTCCHLYNTKDCLQYYYYSTNRENNIIIYPSALQTYKYSSYFSTALYHELLLEHSTTSSSTSSSIVQHKYVVALALYYYYKYSSSTS
jgi:hypothetical protein